MSDYLDLVERQLSELTEQGAHRRLRARRPGLPGRGAAGSGPGGPPPPRRWTEVLAVLAAAAVVVAVVAIVLVNAHPASREASSAARHSGSSTTVTTHPTTTATAAPITTPTTASTPIPAHFAPVSFTAIGELTWWLLAPAPCSFVGEQSPCGAILRTTDGGRHFIGLEAPRASLAGRVASSGYSQIRFADLKDGFAYGPDLYATHDGGTTWNRVDLGGQVDDLAISDGEVYATVSSNGGGPDHLMRSAVGTDQWSAVAAAGRVSGGLWVLAREVIVQSGNSSDVLVSTDGGASFASYPAPSPGLPCDFEAQSPPVIWAHCATGTESGVWRSTNSGVDFATVGGSGLSPLPNSAQFAAASDTTAVVGYQQLYRTADAGATWTAVTVPGVVQWAYLGFTDSTHGVALGYVGSVSSADERLYYTTDGGQSYHLVSIP